MEVTLSTFYYEVGQKQTNVIIAKDKMLISKPHTAIKVNQFVVRVENNINKLERRLIHLKD